MPGRTASNLARNSAATFVQGVEKYPIDVKGLNQFGQGIEVRHRLAACSSIPGVVINEYLEPTLVKVLDQKVKPVKASGHITVEIKLIAIVDTDPRVGVPQNNAIESAKFLLGFIQEACEGVFVGLRVVEFFVQHHQEVARKGRGDPGEIRATIKRVIIAQTPTGRFPPL